MAAAATTLDSKKSPKEEVLQAFPAFKARKIKLDKHKGAHDTFVKRAVSLNKIEEIVNLITPGQYVIMKKLFTGIESKSWADSVLESISVFLNMKTKSPETLKVDMPLTVSVMSWITKP
jgi:hypothetical protein